ncbi:hypothetical protein M413DRAFT_449811 [Hebeloma cylindrosporum]|uniref:Uncharacterized protein n=1 Tax=Hebeloma cylindrosporum TaxID=76867 RepID=A0A0C3BTD5_HEBCY|nr:hypothetical protein M413DRAFT_449811 [Hebeloma cylindrosporum h7]
MSASNPRMWTRQKQEWEWYQRKHGRLDFDRVLHFVDALKWLNNKRTRTRTTHKRFMVRNGKTGWP